MTRKQNDIPVEALVLVAAVAVGVLGAITAVGTASMSSAATPSRSSGTQPAGGTSGRLPAHAGVATPPSALSSPATSVIEAFASPNSIAVLGSRNSGFSTPA